MNKPTKTEKNRRINIVYQLLTQGLTYNEIFRHLTEKEGLDITSRTADNYIREAYKTIEQEQTKDRERIRHESSHKLQDLYKKNYMSGNYAECRRIIDTLGKINGLQGLDLTSGGEKLRVIQVPAELVPDVNAEGEKANDNS